MRPVVFAVHAHPDDIEFMMAGTLFLLQQRGWDVHYMTIADGNCGSATMGPLETAKVRAEEAKRAVEVVGGTFHESLTHDMEVFYERGLLARLAGIVRRIAPDVMLVPSPEDYMEDHMNACRLAVSAAFVRGVPNFETVPAVSPISKDVTIYHALPHGLITGLNAIIRPEFVVDISSTIDKKELMLSQHHSQKDWLDRSQGFDSYLATMRSMSQEVGKMVSPSIPYGEGWRRHSHIGYSATPVDPLRSVLSRSCHDLPSQMGAVEAR
jgi:N-acetylglucosamine malate deacetylase 1